MKYERDRIWPKLLAFAVFLFVVYTNYTNLQEHAALMNEAEQHQAEVKVQRKIVELDLFSGPRYTVQVGSMLESGVPVKRNASIIGVDRQVFEQLDVGDYLEGYVADGEFYTDRLLKEETRWFYILFTFFSLYPIGFVLYWLFKIRPIRDLFKRFGKLLSLGSFISYFVLVGIAVLLIAFFASEIKTAAENSYEKFFGKHHIETTAHIVEKDLEWRTSKYTQSKYYFSLMFTLNDSESLYVVKEVTRHTYNQYAEEMPIVYNEENPYQVFARDMGLWDVVYILTRNTVIAFVATGVVVVLLSLLPYLLWKRKKARH